MSEINYTLDNPAETKITIQNYRTDYEDLFQRMAATIKNVEYGTGNYSNVSSSLFILAKLSLCLSRTAVVSLIC